MSIENFSFESKFQENSSKEESSEDLTFNSLLKHLDEYQDLPSDLTEETKTAIEKQMTQDEVLEYYETVSLIEPSKRQEILDSWLPRPKELYHGTDRKEQIEELVPKEDSKRDPNEDPKVFGTPSKVEVLKYLIKHDDSFVRTGSITTDEGPNKGRKTYMVIYDISKFEDAGGWIYTLPPDSFDADIEDGKGLYEWTSSEAVEPIEAEYYPPGHALQELIESGVEVKVSDMETLAKIDALEEGSEEWQELIQQGEPISNITELKRFT
ncbi:MAG: hypothetical protein ABEI13_02535 [Candidatus Paceibacteria bacterium]